MSLRLHDTLSDQKLPFETAEPGHARIYVCGPTVYDYAHLGHVRCYVVYDVLVRHLRATGTRVTYVRNITDIDDKIAREKQRLATKKSRLQAQYARLDALLNTLTNKQTQLTNTISSLSSKSSS